MLPYIKKQNQIHLGKKRKKAGQIIIGGNGKGREMLWLSIDQKEYLSLMKFCQKQGRTNDCFTVMDFISSDKKAVTIDKHLYDEYIIYRKKLE